MSELEKKKHGRRYDSDLIDRLLWLVAQRGGSATAARQDAVELCESGEWPESVEDLPHSTTIYNWRRNIYRERFSELVRLRAEVMEKEIASDATVLVRQIREAEERAVKQTLAGLGDASAIEASTILRNLGQSKAIQLDAATGLERRKLAEKQAQSVHDIADSLNRLAGSQVVEIIEGDAEEESVEEAVVVDES